MMWISGWIMSQGPRFKRNKGIKLQPYVVLLSSVLFCLVHIEMSSFTLLTVNQVQPLFCCSFMALLNSLPTHTHTKEKQKKEVSGFTCHHVCTYHKEHLKQKMCPVPPSGLSACLTACVCLWSLVGAPLQHWLENSCCSPAVFVFNFPSSFTALSACPSLTSPPGL